MRAKLQTPRLTLEPVEASHFEALWEVYKDPELHTYVPKQPMTYQESLERSERWSKDFSSTGKSIMNWAARDSLGEILGHFQAQIETTQIATVGYIIKKEHHRKGYAFEGLKIVFEHLLVSYPIFGIQASIDSRNEASIGLAKKLGMKQTELNKNANIAADGTSDECIYTYVKEISSCKQPAEIY